MPKIPCGENAETEGTTEFCIFAHRFSALTHQSSISCFSSSKLWVLRGVSYRGSTGRYLRGRLPTRGREGVEDGYGCDTDGLHAKLSAANRVVFVGLVNSATCASS